MSTFTGPGVYRIVVAAATTPNLNLFSGNLTSGAEVRLYDSGLDDTNAQWEFVDAGANEYHIVSLTSGLFLAKPGTEDETVSSSQVSPTDLSVRWSVGPVYGTDRNFVFTKDDNRQLNVAGYNYNAGAAVIAYHFEGNENSQFLLQPV